MAGHDTNSPNTGGKGHLKGVLHMTRGGGVRHVNERTSGGPKMYLRIDHTLEGRRCQPDVASEGRARRRTDACFGLKSTATIGKSTELSRQQSTKAGDTEYEGQQFYL